MEKAATEPSPVFRTPSVKSTSSRGSLRSVRTLYAGGRGSRARRVKGTPARVAPRIEDFLGLARDPKSPRAHLEKHGYDEKVV